MGQYYYFCDHCDWPFEGRDTEGDAWGDGVEHLNNHHHEGGKVRYWDGREFEDVFVHDQEGHHHHHHHLSHHEHEHHGHHEEPHIF